MLDVPKLRSPERIPQASYMGTYRWQNIYIGVHLDKTPKKVLVGGLTNARAITSPRDCCQVRESTFNVARARADDDIDLVLHDWISPNRFCSWSWTLDNSVLGDPTLVIYILAK